MAFCRVVKLGETSSLARKRIEVGRLDFTSVTTKVGKTKIVDHDDYDVRRCGFSAARRRRNQYHGKQRRDGPGYEFHINFLGKQRNESATYLVISRYFVAKRRPCSSWVDVSKWT